MTAAHELGLDALVEAHDADELSARRRARGRPDRDQRARPLDVRGSTARAQLELVEAAPRDRVVVAESAIAARAHGAEAELAGADAVLVGSTLMRAPDPAAKLAELLARPLVKVCGLTREEDVAAAAEAGADLAGFILAQRDAAARAGGAAGPGHDALGRGPRRRGHRRRRRPRAALRARERPPLARRRPAPRTAARSRASSTARGRRQIPATSSERAPPRAGSCSPAGSRPRTSARRSSACGRGRSTRAPASRLEPGIKDHDRIRAFVEAATMLTYGEYGGRFVPETLIPALDELEAGWRAAREDPSFQRRAGRARPQLRGPADAADAAPSASPPASGST